MNLFKPVLGAILVLSSAAVLLTLSETAEAYPLGCKEPIHQMTGFGAACRMPDGMVQYFIDGKSAGFIHPTPDPKPIASAGEGGALASSADVDGDGIQEPLRHPDCVFPEDNYPFAQQVVYAYTDDRSSGPNTWDDNGAAVAGTRAVVYRANTHLHEEAVFQGSEADYKVFCKMVAAEADCPGAELVEDWGPEAGNEGKACVDVWVCKFPGTDASYGDSPSVKSALMGNKCPGHENDPRINAKTHFSVVYDNPSGCSSGCGGMGDAPQCTLPGYYACNGGSGSYMVVAVTYGDSHLTFMHENGHNMGAVQSDSSAGMTVPDSNQVGHCFEEADLMCYPEGAAESSSVGNDANMHQTGGGARAPSCSDFNHFDCQADTYFNVTIAYIPNPSDPSGNTFVADLNGDGAYTAADTTYRPGYRWISTGWNIGAAHNRYLYFGNDVPKIVLEEYTVWEDLSGMEASDLSPSYKITTSGGLKFLDVGKQSGVLGKGVDTDGDEDPIMAYPAFPYSTWYGGATGLKSDAALVDSPFGPAPTGSDDNQKREFPGFALEEDGAFQYAPLPNFFGDTAFQYQAADPLVRSLPGTVKIHVLPVNDPPQITLSAAAAAGTGIDFDRKEDIQLPAFDLSGPYYGLKFTQGASGANAGPMESDVLSLVPGSLSYPSGLFTAAPTITFQGGSGYIHFVLQENAYSNGPQDICFQVMDNGGTARGGVDRAAPTCIKLNVKEQNDAPLGVADAFTVCDDTPKTLLDVLTNDLPANLAGPDQGITEVLTMSVLAGSGTTLAVDGVTKADARAGTETQPDGSVLLTFDTDDLDSSEGTLHFSYRLVDRLADGVTARSPTKFTDVDVAITIIDCALWAFEDSYSTFEDLAFVADGITNPDPARFAAAPKPVGWNDRVRGPASTTEPVGPINAYRFELQGNLPPANAAAFTFNTTTGAFTFTPAANYTGTTTFRYTLVDNSTGVAPEDLVASPPFVTVSLVVAPVNDAPRAFSSTLLTEEDVPVTLDLKHLVSDVDAGDVLQYDLKTESDLSKPLNDGRFLSADLKGVILGSGSSISLDNDALGVPSNITYYPPLDYSGSVEFAFRVRDRALGNPDVLDSGWARLTVLISDTNDAPRGIADVYSVRPGQTLHVLEERGVLANDDDPENNPMLAQLGATASHGALTFREDGSFVYVPQSGYVGLDTFSYRPFDGSVGGLTIVTIRVQGNTPPVAFFTASATTIDATLPVTFRDLSTDEDGRITRYEWSFGDGTASLDRHPRHTFSSPGYYMVSLTVADTDGATDMHTQRIVVTERGGSGSGGGSSSGGPTGFGTDSQDKPLADAGKDQVIPEGRLVILNGTGRPLPLVGYAWTQVEGPTVELTGATESRAAFIAPQVPTGASTTMRFQLTVFNGRLESDPDEVVLTITDTPAPPPSVEAGPRMTVDANDLVILTAGTTNFAPGSPIALDWTQLDGTPVVLTSSGGVTSFTAPTGPATMTFRVVARTANQVAAPDTLVVDVREAQALPVIDYAKGRDAKAGLVAFEAQGGNVAVQSVRWDFGDGTTSDEVAPVHNYAKSGTYTVQMTVTDETGTEHVIEDTVVVGVRGESRSKDSPGVGLALVAVAALGAAMVLRRKL